MMRTLTLMLAGGLVAGSAAAQTPGPVLRAATDMVAAAETNAGTAQATQPTTAAPARKAEPRRRGSMVGYIDDATFSSNVRVRFDAAFGGERPDRAEFFYAKCGCYQALASVDPPAYDPNAPGPLPGVVTQYDFRQMYFQGQYGIRDRVAFFVELPVRWLEPKSFLAGTGSFPAASGLSDVRAGVKVALVATPDAYLTAQLRGDFASGDAAKGLGTNHGTIVPELIYYQAVNDRFSIESMVGDSHPLSGSAGVPTATSDKFSGDVLFWGFGPAYEVYHSDRVRFAPVVELVGWHVLGGFQTEIPGTAAGVAVPVDGINIVNLKIGARTTIDDTSSVYVGYGHALTSTGWYDDIVRLEFRYTF